MQSIPASAFSENWRGSISNTLFAVMMLASICIMIRPNGSDAMRWRNINNFEKKRDCKGAEMKLESDDWSLNCSKYRSLLVSRFLRLPKFISRAFCLAGIAKEEQVEDCLQN